MKKTAYIIILTAVMASVCSCIEKTEPDYDIDIDPNRPMRTLLLYSAGYNSLSSELKEDIDDICGSFVPLGNVKGSDNLFVLAHHSDRSNYRDNKPPCLVKIWKDGKMTVHRDTVYTFPEGTSAIDTAVMAGVLRYIRDNYESVEYGMIFSSHATGWLPPAFSLTAYSYFSASEGTVSGESGAGERISVQDNNASGKTGPERSIGQDAGTGAEFDVKDFVKAIPMKLDYIIFDACLVGGIEVAYEFRDVCDHLVFSQTEILADGLVYTNVTHRLLEENPANLVGVAEDFYDHYNSLDGAYRSATISVVDCARLDGLAEVCGGIFDAHREEMAEIDASEVQPMRSSFRWFYDFRDILAHCGISDEEAAALDEAMEECILYKANTDNFIDTPIRTFSGLSMYLPAAVRSSSTRTYLNSYYMDFKWNKDSGYIK